jgi:molybdenum cofactor guanylyltransferase
LSAPLVAVLAGGRGSRIGGGKPARPLAGRPLIAWPLEAAVGARLQAVVVAKAGTPLPELDVPVWHEPAEPVHPLLGIIVALERASDVIAVGCDMPFVTAEALRVLAGTPAPAGPEALLARYGREALPALREGLRAQAALRQVFDGLEPGRPPIDPRCRRNVNTPRELAQAEAELARGR